MKKVFLSGVLIVLWLCSLAADAQSAPALLRMERVQPGEAVCVLVQDDGSYRLEKLFRAKTEMYTGSPDSARAEQLRTMLASEQLRKLSQEDIYKPLISDTIDDLQLAIWRNVGWQELAFHAPESRKPFKESLDHWFQDLQKHLPESVRVEGPPMRCMPVPVNRLAKKETPETPQPPASTSTPAQYFFRTYSSHFYGGRVDNTCTIVFGNGSYHRERSNQSYRGDRRDKVVDGELAAEAIQELKAVLGSSELESSPSAPNIGNPGPAQEGTITVVTIPRQSKVQSLIFSTAFNTLGKRKQIGGLTNLQYEVADQKLLDPLRSWMKLYIDQHHDAVERQAEGNDCHPLGAIASGKGDPQ